MLNLSLYLPQCSNTVPTFTKFKHWTSKYKRQEKLSPSFILKGNNKAPKYYVVKQ